jgi:hypothetical protein
VTVRLIERFGVRPLLIAGVLILLVASGGLGALTLFLWPALCLCDRVMGVPYAVVSTASNRGLYVSARPEERGVAARTIQTCPYPGPSRSRCCSVCCRAPD